MYVLSDANNSIIFIIIFLKYLFNNCIFSDAAKLQPDVTHVHQISADYNQTVTFSLNIIANPAPVYKWSRIYENKESTLLPKSKVTSYTFTSNLTIPVITEHDMLSYICRVRNAVGTSVFLFKLLLATCEYLMFYLLIFRDFKTWRVNANLTAPANLKAIEVV